MQWQVFHNWLVDHLKKRLSRDYREIRVNLIGQEKEEFSGFYPDMILGNHGHVLALLEVETEESISDERATYWKQLSKTGTKLILLVPEHAKSKVTDLLWKNGIMHNVSVGSYSMKIAMP